MIEVIYKEEKSGEENEYGFSLPRNIRQVGLIHENYRIYMEDYVYTFLGKVAALASKTEHLGRAAILTGEIRWKDGITYMFIRGAVLLEETELAEDHILFEEETWEKVGKECRQYFPYQEVVGWFLTQSNLQIRATDIFTRAHIKYFGGEKVLFLMEPMEHEDAFFRFENNFLIKQSGYYLYYEKNEAMQNYMLARKELLEMNVIEKNKDEAVKNFRKIIQNKNEDKIKEESGGFLSYAAVACLMLTVGAAGLRFYRNYQEMQTYGMVQETTAANSYNVEPVLTKKPTITSVPPKETKESEKTKKTAIVSVESDAKKDVKLSVSPTPLPKEEKNKKETKNSNTKNKKDVIETSNNKNHITYVVRPGDSLFQISLEYYGTIDAIPQICEENGFSEEEVIYPGQIIVLP